ncbi:DUF6338 family protein [Parafrankia sp. EUN1f]|uniref:DUF6338 family protein n=1 Tax=Parafrankia sp. EUN1f TaxID=102897 RepID=UPI0001C44D43|nr:DUF6338 family protein [Parafrankia sp. EUN1f]EFC86585.1 hypothetical protein FrEUN1fDRAFT_0270 [Parafrankia sp. EUN1f]
MRTVQPPSTIGQTVAVVLLVLPGVTYQFLRERWRGPVAGETQLAERVLRAVTASVVLNAVYLVVAGPALVTAWRRAELSGLSAPFIDHPRSTAAWGLLLVFGVPGAAAAAVSSWQRRHAGSAYRSTPTAWDHLFGAAAQGGPRFVRARLKDGTWVGGWYGSRSYASGYPQPADLYLQRSYRMGRDGSFGSPVEGTDGIYIRMADVDIMELVTPARNTQGEQDDHGPQPPDQPG